MNVAGIVTWLRKSLYAELSQPSFQRQFSRFFWFTLASYLSAAAAGGWQFTWISLWGLLPPAVWVGAEEAWPTLPWAKVVEYLEAARTPAITGAKLSDILPPSGTSAADNVKEQT